ncbi:MAG: hypothetical protein FD153_1875 [Rhodospirillaceae bacterium]|nr:MAG: hypothetical protein FD153_1875 [Rhodospirillaceae bacterium]
MGQEGFGRRGKEGAERDIISSLFGSYHGQMTRVMTGDTNNGPCPDQPSGLRIGRVVLPYVYAITP